MNEQLVLGADNPPQHIHTQEGPVGCEGCMRKALLLDPRMKAAYETGRAHAFASIRDRSDLSSMEPPTSDQARSRAAAKSMQFPARGLRRRILHNLRINGPRATWQLEAEFAGLHQTISPRVHELARGGWITVVGTNKTPSGRSADVYALAPGVVERLAHATDNAGIEQRQ